MKLPQILLPLALLAVIVPVAPATESLLLDEGAPCDYLVPSVANGGSVLGLSWADAAAPANIANWLQGQTGIGYDDDPDYEPYIKTDVDALMKDLHPTIYIRLNFTISDAGQLAAIKQLGLNVRSDDGFIAYLNGVKVADRNPPAGDPAWDSSASGTTDDAAAEQLAPFNITAHIGELVVGDNLLAVHGLNASNGSSDFLISPQLVADDAEPPVLPELRLVEVASGLVRPVDVQNAGDGSGRLFVVEKPGRVRVITAGGLLLPTPFLDISGPVDDGSNEEGLLGLAFPPDFATKQHFYVYYTGPIAAGGGGVSSDSIISRFSVSGDDPNIADAGSEEVILRVGQPFSNHNGGQIQFRPTDGFLYIAFGDGGSGNDPDDRAQNPMTLLGKMVRIDVEGAPDAGLAYSVPPTNPFVGEASTLDEIWALGLRNPYRFGFDRMTGDMYIGDVGQGAIEEIDFEAASDPGGHNYGWPYWEGTRMNITTGIVPTDPVFPFYEYASTGSNCSVISGFVYRGMRFPRMQGSYFFSDYCARDLRQLERDDGGAVVARSLIDMQINPTGFGESEDGTLYVVADSPDNRLYRIEDSQDLNYLRYISTGETPEGLPTFEVGVAIGKSYQLQVSEDLKGWEDVGDPVLADDFALTFELPAENFSLPRQFLRIAELD